MLLSVVLFKVSIVALVFGLGLRASARDVVFECWQPRVLLRLAFKPPSFAAAARRRHRLHRLYSSHRRLLRRRA